MKIRTLLTTVACLACCSPLALGAEWSVYTSEHFTMYSDEPETKVRGLLADFEVFRKAVLAVTGIQDRPENLRMTILVYKDSREFRKVVGDIWAGMYVNTNAGPRMLIGPIDSRSLMTGQEVLFHEYVHYLLREHSEIVYPKWYDEGFADLLGSTTIENGTVVVGAVPAGRVESLRTLRDMSIPELLEPQYDSGSPVYWGRFYAHAWLFTHYLQFGSLGQDNEIRRQTREYLQRVSRGEAPVPAFAASYGMSPEDMDAELTRYARSRRIPSIELDLGEYSGDFGRRDLDDNEQAFLLADIAWRRGNEKVALDLLEDLSPDAAEAARPLSLSAVLRNHNEDFERATRDADAALSLAPNDSQVLSNLAHLAWDRYVHSREGGEPDQTLLTKSIELGQKSLDADPLNLEAYGFLWRCYGETGDVADAARAMMGAYQIVPSSASINYTIGKFLFEQERHDLAVPFLERALAWSHSEERQQEVSDILLEIRAAANN